MQLRDYFQVVSRRKWVVIVTTLVVLITVALTTLLIKPIYTTSATLRLSLAATRPMDYMDVNYLPVLMSTYAELATSDSIMAELTSKLGLEKLPKISVEGVSGTELLEVTVEDTDATLTSEAANTLAEILVTQSEALYAGAYGLGAESIRQKMSNVAEELRELRREFATTTDLDDLDTLRQTIALKETTYGILQNDYGQTLSYEQRLIGTVSVVEAAEIPESPSVPRPKRDIPLALLAGLLGGIGLTFVFENLDTTVRTVEQAKEVTQLPVLGWIPSCKAKGQKKNVFDFDVSCGQAFAWLGTSLFNSRQGASSGSILVTSIGVGNGKSTVVINLAHVLSLYGKKVVVIDGNLRRPVLHQWLGLSNEVGLANVLQEKVSVSQAIQDSAISGVSVLTAGSPPGAPINYFEPAHISALIEQLTAHFDIILLDSPALSTGPEVVMLARNVGDVLLVVETGKTQRDNVTTVLKQLNEAGVRLTGVIMNRA